MDTEHATTRSPTPHLLVTGSLILLLATAVAWVVVDRFVVTCRERGCGVTYFGDHLCRGWGDGRKINIDITKKMQ